jgi:glycosyltransferase involved in cell wall biosynthesis
VRLLLVNYEYPPIGAGAANATMFMARALAELGHEVSVLTTAFQNLRGLRSEQGVCVYRLDARRALADRSNLGEMASFLVAALRRARSVAQERRVEGLIVFFTVPCGPIGWALRRWLSVPYVVSLRGGDVPGLVPELNGMHRLLAPARRAILRGARAVVANSVSLAHLSESADRVPVRVIPNGVDSSVFQPAPRVERGQSDKRNVLFVGRLQAQKNLGRVLKSFAEIRSLGHPARLHIVGDGPLRADMQALAARLCDANDLVWHGWLPKEKLAALYQFADIFVNPSLYEGMPNTVLEAMSSGLPVIASNTGGNDALVQDGVTGLLFDLAEEGAFTRCLSILLGNSEKGHSMGEAGRARVVSDFSWRSVASRYVEIFGEPGRAVS